MSAGLKCNIKQIKDLTAVSYAIFVRSILKSWKIKCKKRLYFSFDFGSYSIHLDIVC